MERGAAHRLRHINTRRLMRRPVGGRGIKYSLRMMTRWAAVSMMCNSIYWLLFVGSQSLGVSASVCVCVGGTQTESKCQFVSEQEVCHVTLL